jgi:putative membrane protein
MRYLLRVVEIFLLIVLVAITVENSHAVELHLFFGQVISAPLIVFLLVFFVAGALIGLLATLGYYLRMRRELSQLKKEIRSRQTGRYVPDPSDALAE